MHSEPQTSRQARARAAEPIAIVGIAALYPHARGVAEYWELMRRSTPPCSCSQGGVAASGLDDLDIDVARFGIPPAQRGSLNRMQLLMLEAAAQCLVDAGHDPRSPLGGRTDVVCATSFGLDRQLANALRVEAVRYTRDLEAALAAPDGALSAAGAREAADELRALLTGRLGGSPHDRVGEMPSSIPARIAAAFKLHGRTVSIESADAGSFVALAAAVDSLRAGHADAVLVAAGQRREGALLERALDAKGLLQPDAHPFAADGYGLRPGEGVSALLLKPLSGAQRSQDRIYALIRDCTLVHHARPGVFRYSPSTSHRLQAAAAAHHSAAVPPTAVQYVESAAASMAPVARADLDALGALFAHRLPGSIALGSAQDRLGHTICAAGLAAVTKAALALHHRHLPAQAACPKADPLDLSGTAFRFTRTTEPWLCPEADLPRRAAVVGSSLTGTVCYLLLDEHVPKAAASGAAAIPAAAAARRSQPVAILAAAGSFADRRTADDFWRTSLHADDRIRPLPAELLDRELYFRPGSTGLAQTYTELGAALPPPKQPPPGLHIIPRRYAAMDPAQRLILDVADQLFASCHTRPADLRGRGLIAIGSSLSLSRERRLNAQLALPEIEQAVKELAALRHLTAEDRDAVVKLARERFATADEVLGPVTLDGYLASGAAALIANEFRLSAVPVAVEAACASALAAVDMAISALRTGSADYAIAGGVELPCNERDLVLCSALGLLSPTRITPFAAGADGFTPGDGCALFLLKREEDCTREGERILGLIRGVGASNDAKSLIAPDADGQARAMREAFGQVDFGPDAVGYLEAHGTGTRVGDRVEIDATTQVYGKTSREEPLRIGTAKAAFGHTFAAAGGAGLLRALYAVRTATYPPTAGEGELNPAIDLHAIPAEIPRRPQPWTSPPDRPRRAAVSSFGTGGINYHLLIEEPGGAIR
ncbi:MAG TPA: polyketide synthase [Actinocrinis sp.]|uniref:beta-ketoacyl [acyl carrier protein] synthase domain-containing protein n=1 Tax=Actinocrinis sp. TaxID=1920516 RepID=UPI002D37E292|nr:polyketide synthase [Actinocrinis sp.]HZU57909.1 polyketide synthase [Actinocrinis sp.]